MKDIFGRYLTLSFDDDDYSKVKVRQFVLNYSRFFPDDRDARILDIGPGRGELLMALSAEGFRNVQAVDISPEVVERCRPLARDVFLVDDTKGFLAHTREAYSLITVLDVLEHLGKPEVIPFLVQLRRNIADEGKVIIQVPNMGGIFPALHRYNDFTHEVCFGDHSLRQVLLASGFTRICFYPFENLVGSPLKCRLAKLARDHVLYSLIRLIRMVDGSLNPDIINPVFFAVAQP